MSAVFTTRFFGTVVSVVLVLLVLGSAVARASGTARHEGLSYRVDSTMGWVELYYDDEGIQFRGHSRVLRLPIASKKEANQDPMTLVFERKRTLAGPSSEGQPIGYGDLSVVSATAGATGGTARVVFVNEASGNWHLEVVNDLDADILTPDLKKYWLDLVPGCIDANSKIPTAVLFGRFVTATGPNLMAALPYRMPVR